MKTGFIFEENFSTRLARKPVIKSKKILIFFIASLKLRNSKNEFYRCKIFHRLIMSVGHIDKLTVSITDYIMESVTVSDYMHFKTMIVMDTDDSFS